jgi:hypothetical protein
MDATDWQRLEAAENGDRSGLFWFWLILSGTRDYEKRGGPQSTILPLTETSAVEGCSFFFLFLKNFLAQ